MSLIEFNTNPSRGLLLTFALFVLAVGFAMGAVWYFRTAAIVGPVTVAAIGGVVGAMGLIAPRAVRPIYFVWMAIGYPIGWLISWVLLAGVFFLVFTPVGLACRLWGYDPMKRRFDPDAPSYWIPRKTSRDVKRYFRQY
jgi:hypothetical protein